MLLESIRFAIEALSRNALRSALTALGIFIGVGAVIAMISIGQGAGARVKSEIAKLGSDLITIKTGQQMRSGAGLRMAAEPFEYSDIPALQSMARGIKHIAPYASRQQRAVARNLNWSVQVAGTESGYFLARDWPLAHGRLFTEEETFNGRAVCIIGDKVRARLYADHDPLGEPLRIGTIPCTVIGVLAARGQSGAAEDEDNIVALPFDAFQRRIQGTPRFESIVLSAHPGTNLRHLKNSIAAILRERRGIAPGVEDDFSILDMRQVAESMAATTRTMTLFLGAIAAVSLLVGGIGIMNIMLVSVIERTKEIGVRLAIGALPSQIRLQFLVEAVMLTSLGGLIGIAGGVAAAAMATPALGVPLIIDPAVIASSVAVSVLLGLGFGYLPAAKAARLHPIEALRRD